MTREEAIIRIADHAAYLHGKPEPTYQIEVALDTAIAALREQEERSKGCDWCYPNKLCGTCLHNVDYHEDGTDKCSATLYEVPCSHYKSFPFCPMCGRRLEEV